MFKIYPKIYERLASLLQEAIAGRTFYSGIIRFEDEDDQVDYLFSATLLIYYEECRYPEGYTTEIKNIEPVWWEFHSTLEHGEEINDFDLRLLKEVICN